MLAYLPVQAQRRTGLIFIYGSGVSADVYGVLLRPIADAGEQEALARSAIIRVLDEVEKAAP